MKKKEIITRTDLAFQKNNFTKVKEEITENFIIKEYIEYEFNYTNIIFKNIETKSNKNKLTSILIKELKKYLKKYKLNKNKSVLVVGLGNKNIASDSLGPLTINNVIATGYYEKINITERYRKVYAYNPGIMKNTGIMPIKGVKAMKKELEPDFIIVIDSLISSDIKYLNKVIQITDAGITPGSGTSNYQEEISKNTLNIPVIVIGIPTAIEMSTIIKNIIGTKEKKNYFKEGYNFIFSSKDIDIKVSELSKILGMALNKSLNNINNF